MEVHLCTVHCTATENGEEVSISAIEKDHISRGFGGIGYHIIIQPDGTKITTRPLNQVGAHVKGSNTGNIGIALAGTDRFTYNQFLSLYSVLEMLRISFSLKPEMIFCHHEFQSAKDQGKTCPSIRAVDLVVWYMSQMNSTAIDKYLI